MFKKIVLDNGLRVITAPMQGTNTVTVLVLCATGSDYESKDINGISHFLEHMFFKGTKRRPKPGIVHRELDELGSVHNAFTSHEITGYFVKVGKDHFLRALDILADIYNNVLIDDEEVKKEGGVIIEEMRMYKDNPLEYIGDVWEKLLYGDQPAGREIIGDEKTIRAIGRNDLYNYFYHQYTASNTAVVVAGNFEEGYALESVKSFFKDVRNDTPLRKKPPVKENQNKPGILIHQKATDQTHLMLGFHGYDASHPRRYIAEVLAILLGGGASSRMFTRIREDLGLAYAISSDFRPYSNRGFLSTYAGVDHTNIDRTIKAILGEYKRVCEEKLQEEELKRVKDYIKGTTLIGLEQSNAVASFVGTEEVVTGKPLTVDEVFAKIEAVTPDDLLTVAKEIIRPEGLNLAMIGPFKEKEKFEQILKEF